MSFFLDDGIFSEKQNSNLFDNNTAMIKTKATQSIKGHSFS